MVLPGGGFSSSSQDSEELSEESEQEADSPEEEASPFSDSCRLLLPGISFLKELRGWQVVTFSFGILYPLRKEYMDII